METTTYDPVQGTGWDQRAATRMWSLSMNRNTPAWQLRGGPGKWRWEYFDFKPFIGRVTIAPDGFHWETFHTDSGETLCEGVTTSLYVAYQSVIQNQPVAPPGGEVRPS